MLPKVSFIQLKSSPINITNGVRVGDVILNKSTLNNRVPVNGFVDEKRLILTDSLDALQVICVEN